MATPAVSQGAWERLVSARGQLCTAIAAGVLLLTGVVMHAAAERLGAWADPAAHVLSWVSLALGMFHGCRAAWESVRELKFDIDVLMVVGAGLAAGMGKPAEGALLLFLFVFSGALEELAMARTTRAVEALHKLMPTRAVRWKAGRGTAGAGDEQGEWETVPPEELAAGDVVKVMPGESVPTDARIVEGRGSVDQANLTGESMPRTVQEGDTIYAGTINVGNPLRAVVTKVAKESSLQRVLDLVISAQQQREPVQRLVDKVSQPYALGVLATSVAVLLVWWLYFRDPFRDAAFTAMTLLIVASPCAVIIATPTATLAAIARAARAGVLFKGGQAMERLSRLSAICFDKTGTLTVGKMRVREVLPVGWSNKERMLAAAAGLEQDSTHPIASAIREGAKAAGVEPATVENPTFTVGRGVGGTINGHPARLGSLVFATELIPVCLRAKVREELSRVQKRGQIGVVIAAGDETSGQAGVVILGDTTRPGAERLVSELHAIGVAPVMMLTGDNADTAKAVAEALGIDRVKAELLPEHKVQAVAELKAELATAKGKRGSAVGVIGDGVNDAPALSAADVSIAIGSIGSDAALESADIVLLADDLGVIPWAVRLARRARKTVRFNLVFALSAIVVMIIAVLVGSRTGRPLPLWMGVLGHEGGTVLVVLNSLLLLVFRSGSRESGQVNEPAAAADSEAGASLPA